MKLGIDPDRLKFVPIEVPWKRNVRGEKEDIVNKLTWKVSYIIATIPPYTELFHCLSLMNKLNFSYSVTEK